MKNWYFTYFTSILNILQRLAILRAQKHEEGDRKRIEYDFVLCIAVSPGLKGRLSDYVSCYQNNKVYYSTGNHNFKMEKY